MPDWLGNLFGGLLALLLIAAIIWVIVSGIDDNIRYGTRDLIYAWRKEPFVPQSVRSEFLSKWLDAKPEFTGPLRRLRWGKDEYTKEGSAVGYIVRVYGERREIVLRQFHSYLTERGWSAQARTEGGWDFRDGNWRLVVTPSGSLPYETRAELWREATAQAPAGGEGER